MNLDSKNPWLIFFIALLLTVYVPALLPGFKLLFFAPLIIILYYQKSYSFCLWISLICGLILDILSSFNHLGIFALNFSVTTALLYGYRRNFFADSLTTLPLMTFFFSVIFTIFQSILIYTFEGKLILSWKWFMTDLILLPAGDAVFGFACFIFPHFLLGRRPRRGKDYFLNAN